MSPLLAHHFFHLQPPIDSTDSDFRHSPLSSPHQDFPLFPDFDEGQDTASIHLPQPSDLFVLGSLGGDFGAQDSRQSTPYDRPFGAANEQQSMQPHLRIHQYTPNTPSSVATPPPMHEGGNWGQALWTNQQDQAYLSPTTSTHPYNTSPQAWRGHKRLSSGSSAGSTGPDSPFTQTSVFPQIVDSEAHTASSPHIDSFDLSAQPEKPLFYPQTSPFNPIPFVNPDFQNLNIADDNARSVMARQNGQAEAVSSQNRSNMSAPQQPASRIYVANPSYGGPLNISDSTPKFERTESDVYQDELFDNSQLATASGQVQQGSHAYSHAPLHRSMFTDRLQQAQEARSLTPSTDLSRERSPFYENSDFARGEFSQMPGTGGKSRIHPAAQIRDKHHTAHSRARIAPNTISPKEAVLEYQGPSGADSAKFATQTPIKQEPLAYAAPSTSVNGITDANSHNVNSHDDYVPAASNQRSTPTLSSSQQSTSSNVYSYMPSHNGASGAGLPNYPFISQLRRQSSSLRSEQSEVPQFPASLTSMESTRSESSHEPNVRPATFRLTEQPPSQRSEIASPRPRPSDTSAHTNTYTCTEPKCNARFDTAARLHRHKRDNHGTSVTPASPATSTSSVSRAQNPQAAANNASRNNAPGPHRCDRINPSTGRPCGTVFSRSYDLTRHEETIHNSNKKKARCNLCQEEKTFSRNDALTRHMRVVHPDVDYPPSKNRRR